MKKLALFFFVFAFVLEAQDGADYCSQSKINSYQQIQKLNKIAYPGDGRIDITYYKLNLNVSFALQYLNGIITVKGKASGTSVNSFFLDLDNGFTVNHVKSNGSPVNYNLDQSNHLNISLEKNYSGNEEFNIEISYEGKPKTSGGIGGSFVFSSQNGKPLIWTLSQPYGARDWWPSKDTPGDKADSSDVWITGDPALISVSNGILTEVSTNADNTKTYKWHNSYPIANYLISIAMTNYEVYQNQFIYDGKTMPVTNYIYPGNSSLYKPVLDLVPEMLQIFSDKFGLYPFIKEKYGHAECGFGGGMEHQTCTSLGNGAFQEWIIAHELAHQWFGDKVTCKDWNNIWLNEGFASYAECIYFEAKYGNDYFKSYVSNFMDLALIASGSIYVQDNNLSNVGYIFNTARTYKKGAIVLHMLRGIIGDDKFFQTLKEYAAEPGISYNVATTEDFKNIAERVSGQKLDYFFNEWIYGENYPIYTFGWNYKHVDGDNYLLNLRSKQNTNSNPQFFIMPIQVKYITDKETKTITIFNNVQDQGWEIPIVGNIQSVEFDPDNWILKKVAALSKIDDNGNLITDYILKQNYPNPFNPGTVIEYQVPVGSNVKLKIYNSLGQQVAVPVNEFKNAGIYKLEFNAQLKGLASGIYYYELTAGETNQIKKMIFVK